MSHGVTVIRYSYWYT